MLMVARVNEAPTYTKLFKLKTYIYRERFFIFNLLQLQRVTFIVIIIGEFNHQLKDILFPEEK